MADHVPGVEGTTFSVASVHPAARPLQEIPYRQALAGLLAAGSPRSKAERPIEACSCRTTHLVAGIGHHPLVTALRLAFAEHRPIALSPDMIWLLVCQGIGQHIHVHAEALRSRFVRHPGRLTLAVHLRTGGPLPPGTPWPEVFDGLWLEIRRQIGPPVDLFMPSFSTTGRVERAAAGLALFSAMHNYSHPHRTDSDCGIPSVTLEGTAEDWEQILDRLEGFSGLGLDPWLESLRPILQQFEAAARGDIDRTFWSEIYRRTEADGPSPESSSGWIRLLLPYPFGDEQLPTWRSPWAVAGRQRGACVLLDDGPLLIGLTSAPLTWDRRDATGRLLNRRELELLGGFVGVSQHPDTLRLRPEIGWAVRERVG